MFLQHCYKTIGFWPKSFKGLVIGFFLCTAFSLMPLILGGCAEEIDDVAVDEEVLIKQLEEDVANLEEMLAQKQEKIEVLAKAGWSYELLANNHKIFENGYISIDEPNLDIVLRETQPPYYDLYIEEFNQGVLENVADHVTLLTEEKLYQETAADGTAVSDVPIAFLFRDLEPGDLVQLEVSRELQERMHLETEVVTIEKR